MTRRRQSTSGLRRPNKTREVMAKEARIAKIEKMAAEHEADKGEAEPAEPAQPPKDDREKYGLGRFDPSSGSQAQKSSQHPTGDSVAVPVPVRTRLEHAQFMREAAGNRAFRDNERASIREMIAEAEANRRARWR
jgi:hypothetical protein